MPFDFRCRSPLLPLLLITAGAASLRLIGINEPLWLDELHTAWSVSAGLQDVAPRAMQGNQSPLYFLVLYPLVALGDAFGGTTVIDAACNDAAWLLRLPSLLAGVGLVPLMYVVVRQLTGHGGAGLLAAALVAVDRDCLFFAGEARPYAWVQLVALGHVLLFARLLQDPRAGLRLCFIAGGILLFYLHYTAVLLVGVELFAYGVLLLRSGSRPLYRPQALLLDTAAIGLGCTPAIPHLLEIAGRRQQWRPYVPLPGVVDLLRQFRSDVTMLLPVAVVATLAALDRWNRRIAQDSSGRGAKALRQLSWPRPAACVLVAAWALLPRLLAAGFTYAGLAPLALSRYVIASAVAPIAFAALCWSMIVSRRTRFLLAVVLLGLVVYRGGLVSQLARDGRLIGDRQEDWRGAVRYINQRAAAGTPVFLCSGLLEDASLRAAGGGRMAYCRFPVSGPLALHAGLEARPLPTRGEDRLAGSDQEALLAAGRGWWIIRGGPSLVESVLNDLRRQLQTRQRVPRVTDRRRFGRSLTVLRVEVAPRATAAGQ